MTCREFVSRLGNYVDGDLAARKRTECVKHATACPDCAAYLQSYQATVRVARKAYEDLEQPSAEPIARVIDRLFRHPLSCQRM